MLLVNSAGERSLRARRVSEVPGRAIWTILPTPIDHLTGSRGAKPVTISSMILGGMDAAIGVRDVSGRGARQLQCGAQLDHSPLGFLLAVFLAARAVLKSGFAVARAYGGRMASPAQSPLSGTEDHPSGKGPYWTG